MMCDQVFGVWDASQPDDHRAWLAHWESWPGREVFAHPAYVRLFATKSHEQAMCAFCDSDEGRVLYPFILRHIQNESYWAPSIGPATDTVAPYGYGGAFAWEVDDAEATGDRFWSHFEDWAKTQNVVSEFVRLSLFENQRLDHRGSVTQSQWNVIRCLDLDDEEIWMDFEHKVRKNVKRARRDNVEIETDSTGLHLPEFLRIYSATLDRRSARDSYYFSEDFFATIHQELPGQFMYFHAVQGTRIVSTELVLVSEQNIYSFLGGTDREYFQIRPNDLLKYRIITWGKETGRRNFVLGGGYGTEDGIFKYKRAFAPNGVVPFQTCRRVLAPQKYERLIERRSQRLGDVQGNSDFFPAYRAA